MYEVRGSRTVILGPDEPEPPGCIVVRLHPTGMTAKGWPWEGGTAEAIRWLEERVQPGMTVCDVGTGTGILAIVAARLGATVTAYEQSDAVRLIALANFVLSDVILTVHDEYSGERDVLHERFDLVVANLGDVDYEGMGILAAGKEVWTSA